MVGLRSQIPSPNSFICGSLFNSGLEREGCVMMVIEIGLGSCWSGDGCVSGMGEAVSDTLELLISTNTARGRLC